MQNLITSWQNKKLFQSLTKNSLTADCSRNVRSCKFNHSTQIITEQTKVDGLDLGGKAWIVEKKSSVTEINWINK